MRRHVSITLEQNNDEMILTAYSRNTGKVVSIEVNENTLHSKSLNEIIDSLNIFSSGKRNDKAGVLIDSHKDDDSKKIVIPNKNGILYLKINDIIYFEADRSYTYIHTTNGKKHTVTNKSLSEYEQMLESCNFFRPHRSYLINLNLVEKFHRNGNLTIHLKNGIEIPVARRKTSAFHNMMLSIL
ncbi:MAG: hypothetical protein C0594_09020 [Marinilabiliales bacterium]|nr:MAG: hypothetical protein C0594_09020 [Marinilabiliales bacterium]